MAAAATVRIAPAVQAHVPTIGDTLARAFQDDPVWSWVVPDAAARRERLPLIFAAFAEAYLRHQETYLAGAGAGAALWAPPGSEPLGADQAKPFVERIGAVLEEGADRGLQIQQRLEQHHPHQPCFYLQLLGVVPEHQGSGIGGRLLTMVLQRCDATETPAYLEATSPDNRRLYERHGFETVAEIAVPDGPTLWSMWRRPRIQSG